MSVELLSAGDNPGKNARIQRRVERGSDAFSQLPPELVRKVRDDSGYVEAFASKTCDQQARVCRENLKDLSVGSALVDAYNCSNEPLKTIHETTCAKELIESEYGRHSVHRMPFHGFDVRQKIVTLTLSNLGDNDVFFEYTFPRLGELSIVGNYYLTALSAKIGTFTTLNTLNIYEEGQPMTLPSEMRDLTALWSLTYKSKNATRLPIQICDIASLRSLNISGCRLATLPPEIGKLTALRFLSVEDNPLTTLPREIESLAALRR